MNMTEKEIQEYIFQSIPNISYSEMLKIKRKTTTEFIC